MLMLNYRLKEMIHSISTPKMLSSSLKKTKIPNENQKKTQICV